MDIKYVEFEHEMQYAGRDIGVNVMADVYTGHGGEVGHIDVFFGNIRMNDYIDPKEFYKLKELCIDKAYGTTR